MEAKRELILYYYLKNYRVCDILKELKKYKISRQFINRTIKRYNNTGSVHVTKKRKRKCTVRTSNFVKVIRERIRRNPRRSQRKLAADLKVSKGTVQNVLKKDLGLKAYKRKKIHGITYQQKVNRVKRAKVILEWHAEDEIIFSDEKLFTLQQSYNPQNDRIYAANVRDIPPSIRAVPRNQSSLSVMVWGAISKRGKLPLLFIDKGVKINGDYYIQHVLQDHLLPEAKKLFDDDYFLFQQDSAPAHKYQHTQQWLESNLPDYIPASEWPSASPDLNPLDFCIWGYMLKDMTNIRHMNIEQFKEYIIKIWDNIPMDVVRAACDAFPKRLKEVIKAKGEAIELQ